MTSVMIRRHDHNAAVLDEPWLAPEALEKTIRPSAPARSRDVQVIFGAAVQRYPLAGLTVPEACKVLAALLNVDPATPALVNGAPVRRSRRTASEYRLAPDDVLELVHHAGEKG